MINGNVSIKNNTITTAKQQRNSVVYFAEDVLNQGKAILINGKYYGGSQLIETTYKQLRYLKDISSLIPGALYRITDYVTTTVQNETRSAGHQFDVIVTAISENEFNENAKVCKHEGDTYFQNCDLNAWEIKYSIYNDVDRFAWADYYPKNTGSTTTSTVSPTNTETTSTTLPPGYVINEEGKGVIYYMKDEFNNEAWYDFKNIQFLRPASWFIDNPKFWTQFVEDTYFYTFSIVDDGIIKDDSLYSENSHATDNHLGRSTALISKLNNTIFIDKPNNGVFNNTIADGHYNNTFGQSVWNNTFGHNFINNIFNKTIQYNVIDANYKDNKAYGNFIYNTVGCGCYSNNFAGNVTKCTFKQAYYYNNFIGDMLYQCTFEPNNNWISDIPSLINVTFSNNCITGESSIYLNDLITADGESLLTALNSLNGNYVYTVYLTEDNKYTLFSPNIIDKLNNIKDIENKLLSPIYSNPNLDFEDTRNNVNTFGYVGTLQNINVNGDLILIDSISVYTREGSIIENTADIPVWCRLLKFVDNTWKPIYQSTDSKAIRNTAPETLFSFKMKAIDDQNKLIKSSDKIAIIYVNNENTEVISNIQLGFKSISKPGGLQAALANNSTGVSGWAPAFVIGYLSMADDNYVNIENSQTITGAKQFNGGINIAGKSFITSVIDPGELKVLHNNSAKGFIVRTVNGADSILPLQILSTNGSDSYQYDFPSKNGTVVLDNDLDTINSRLDDFIAETNNGNESLLLIIRDLVSRIEALENK